ncbi:MAG TPA: DUF6318 family protein, partial [Arthrobacter sp.]|nr:DUF6318 family protein [Arthrobacter sp.]
SSTPVETTTGTPSPAGDPMPSPDGPPTLPAAARGKGARAAKAFVRYYIATVNYATATGDTGQLRTLGTRGCVSCKAISRIIKRIYEADGSIDSHGWKLSSISIVPRQPKSKPMFDLGVVETPQDVYETANSRVKHYKGGKHPMTIHLQYRHAHWRVTRLDLVS